MAERERPRERVRGAERPQTPRGDMPDNGPDAESGTSTVDGPRRGVLWGLAAIIGAAVVGAGGIGTRLLLGSDGLPEPQGQAAGPEYRQATLALQPAPRDPPLNKEGTWSACSEGHASRSASGLDLVLAIDTTGSMGGVINDVKAKLNQLIASLRAQNAAIRVGLVAYRDHYDAYVVKSLPLTSLEDTTGLAGLYAFVGTLQAAGGADWPEAMAAALDTATSMDWRGNVPATVVVIADAPPHPGEQALASSIAQNFRAKIPGGQVSLIDTGSGGNSYMRQLPKIGGGQYITYDGKILNSLFPAISGC